jgi:general secretion pathway protein L
MASEYLFLRLGDTETSWLALDPEGRRLTATQRGPLAAAQPAATGRRLVVLVPARHVISTLADVPVKNAARLRRVLPYSLEENLAQDVEELLFAIGPRRASEKIDVSVVAHERMDHWLAMLRSEGLTANEIYSEAEGVPETPGALTLVLERECIYARPSGGAPFVFDGLGIRQLLDLLQTSGDESQARIDNLQVYADPIAYEKFEADFAALRTELANVDVRLLEDGPLAHFAATLIARPGANLLQGPYAPRSDWSALLRPWRVAAALALAFLAIGLLGLTTEYFVLRARDQSLSELVATSCQQRLGAARMTACRTEIDRRLAAAGAGNDTEQDQFLKTLVAIASSRDAASRITALSYRQGVLDLRVVAPSVPALDEFARKMTEASFTVRIQSASPTDDGVEGQLQVVETRS